MIMFIMWIIFGFIFACVEHVFIDKKDLKVNDLPDIIPKSIYGLLILFKIFADTLKDNNNIIFSCPFESDDYYGYDKNKKEKVSSTSKDGLESFSATSLPMLYDRARKELKKREDERKKKEKEELHKKEMIQESKKCIEEDTYVTMYKPYQKNGISDSDLNNICMESPQADDIDIANKILEGLDNE